MRFAGTWLLFLCFAGLFPFFVLVAVGQGTRDLIDPALVPPQQRTTQPRINQTVPIYVPVPQTGMLPNDGTAASVPTGFPGGVSIPNVPISEALIQRLMGDASASADSVNTPSAASYAELERQILGRLTAVLEELTEDDREERTLLVQRQRAEQIVDPERREAALKQVARDEAARQNRLESRTIDEVGADVFSIPRLKEQYLSTGW